jgi:hypothetical protein
MTAPRFRFHLDGHDATQRVYRVTFGPDAAPLGAVRQHLAGYYAGRWSWRETGGVWEGYSMSRVRAAGMLPRR